MGSPDGCSLLCSICVTVALLKGTQASEGKGRNLATRKVGFAHPYPIDKSSNTLFLAG